MNLELTDEEAAALIRVLTNAIDGDRYPLSPRLQVLRGDPRQVDAGAGAGNLAAAETLRASASTVRVKGLSKQ